ncbi:FdtA/QdtA family cupin domain-containing protein [Pedobacter sp. SYSU D00535]|uniref:sugar 3,4-ketoisomerase n=1 Tax=Pedobacter sp. SYSU D00535 TaxID=2810308 RepID=UPI001A96BF06|nr:FdtA/QdtA family cupin domain-containing protein [Pedobacter sp. SYSU D00535]
MTTNEPRILDLPKILDDRGNLTFLEEGVHIPFKVARTYWIYDVPGGAVRGGHAYLENQELIIALAGSFDVVLDDGTNRKVFSLNRSYYALYIPGKIWRHMENFSTNSLAFIAASTSYNEGDYIRDHQYFQKVKSEGFNL